MNIPEKLKKLRKENDLTLEEMANKLKLYSDGVSKVSKSMVHNWESGLYEPTLSNVILYAKAFNVDLNYLAGLTDTYSALKSTEKHTYILNPDYSSAAEISYDEYYYEENQVELPDSFLGRYAGRNDLEFVKVVGDSMDNIIPDGAIIGYITQVDNYNGGDIVLYRYGSDFGVKRYYDIGDSILFKYDSKNEDMEGKFVVYHKDDSLKIVGKVVLYNVVI